MSENRHPDNWEEGAAYEAFMGRWSFALAQEFVRWLDMPAHGHWLDVGCGTGALTRAICELTAPAAVVACDRAEDFVRHARARLSFPGVSTVVANAMDPPSRPGGFDAVVSGLVFNFLPDPKRAAVEMSRRTCSGGIVAAYVWDYAGRMEFLRSFWDAAKTIDPRAEALDEGVRFPICRPDVLQGVFREAGLLDVVSDALEVSTSFQSFHDFWQPFLGGTGPAPAYVATLSESKREELKQELRSTLPVQGDGRIELMARAWAICGTTP